jgi:hypothetical protein
MPSGNNRIEESSLINEQSSSNNFIADHVIIGHPGFQLKDENRPKGIKI